MRRFSFFRIILITAICLACACVYPLRTGGACRTVHIKAVVDPAIAADPAWRTSITGLFDKTNAVFRQWAGISFAIDTLYAWDIEKSASWSQLLMGDCLVNEISKGESDIVVYFSPTSNPPAMIAGMTLYELGYACIQVTTDGVAQGFDRKTYFSLVHWLAHIFGAVHCYFNGHTVTIMNPFIHDGQVIESSEPRKPVIHRGNRTIMAALAERPFREDQWISALWPPIKQVYDYMRNTNNRWRIAENGEVAGYERDAFHEGNLMLYLSSWASLCGMPREALLYLDSLDLLADAIHKTCSGAEDIANTRICTMCAHDTSQVADWFALQKFYLGMRRCMVLLRSRDTGRADSCFTATMSHNFPYQLEPVKEKYANGYRMYARRYGRQE